MPLLGSYLHACASEGCHHGESIGHLGHERHRQRVDLTAVVKADALRFNPVLVKQACQPEHGMEGHGGEAAFAVTPCVRDAKRLKEQAEHGGMYVGGCAVHDYTTQLPLRKFMAIKAVEPPMRAALRNIMICD